jgi:sirohydrochlorin ferrochelatase
MSHSVLKVFLLPLLLLPIAISSVSAAEKAILVIAHGSMAGHGEGHGCAMHPTPWEKHVIDAVEETRAAVSVPVGVAFGMWETHCFQAAVDRLVKQNTDLRELVVLPLFISSHSIVIEAQKFIFRQAHRWLAFQGILKRIRFDGSIVYLPGIDYDSDISPILVDRAKSLVAAGTPNRAKDLILVMHGPVGPATNRKWLAMGEKYLADVQKELSFRSVAAISLQDDAPAPIRNRNTRQLRRLVEASRTADADALILPLLLSEGGIQASIEKRLEGLPYVWTGEALLPDPRLSGYLLKRVQLAIGSP